MIERKIREIINNKNFIYLDDFIRICHQDSKNGYYRTREIIGKDGDFITSPEISQLFGEVVSFCLINQIVQKNIKNFNLIELGPGKGTLLKDIDRTFKKINNEFDYSIHINEINKNYLEHIKEIFPNCKNHIKFNDYPKTYSTIVANEFFDALPVRQIIVKDHEMKEVGVTIDDNGNFSFDHYEARCDTKNFMSQQKSLQNGQIFEISPDANYILDELCSFLKYSKGHLLIFDYGFLNTSFSSTLQSLYKNQKTNLLDNIGKQDITYHINFSEFKNIIEKFEPETINFYNQSEFLEKNGIHERAYDLIQNNSDAKDEIEQQVKRLWGKEEMGELFKVLEVVF